VTQPSSAVGTPQSRVDGRLKVTGQANYAADHPVEGVTYAAVVDSSVGPANWTSYQQFGFAGQVGRSAAAPAGAATARTIAATTPTLITARRLPVRTELVLNPPPSHMRNPSVTGAHRKQTVRNGQSAV
jgi:hypothetical protein